jgi:UDP-N-acetylglucosamine--N-acetylmuramyl-(pentapeptide) pyrophosphoryl-undecaprenol N-acetylglucosamine transferase
MKPKRSERKSKLRIVLTGGHAATTALATIEELVRRGGWDIYWIGARKAIEGRQVPTLESKVFPKLGINYHPIIAGRLQRRFSLWTLSSMAKIPIGFFHAFFLLLKIRPKVILSFGGFASFPVVVVAFFLKIPVILHEQTIVAGRANRASAPFSKVIALARKESKKYFPKHKCRVIGNPILTQITEIKPKEKIGTLPTLFITGGSRGAQVINGLIEQILGDLVKKYIVIHQTGFLDYQKMLSIRDSLPSDLKERYEVYPFIDPMEIDGVYARADIIVSRAGANTVAEILMTKRPAILIPIPWTYLDEQTKNALLAKEFGLARVLDQEKLTPKKLFNEIDDVVKNWESMVGKVREKISEDRGASQRLVDLIEETI